MRRGGRGGGGGGCFFLLFLLTKVREMATRAIFLASCFTLMRQAVSLFEIFNERRLDACVRGGGGGGGGFFLWGANRISPLALNKSLLCMPNPSAVLPSLALPTTSCVCKLNSAFAIP